MAPAAPAASRSPRPGSGSGPAADTKKWLPSGKRGQRSPRRADRDRFHPSEETTRRRRGQPRSGRPAGREARLPPPSAAATPEGERDRGHGPDLVSRGCRGVVGAAFAVGVAWATNGEPPSPAEVVVSAVPILNVASAKDHGETVIPIIVMLLGWKATVVTGSAYGVYKYGEAVQEEPILAIPPAAAGLGAPAHTLGAKGGYGNLLCYPGKPGCGSRRR